MWRCNRIVGQPLHFVLPKGERTHYCKYVYRRCIRNISLMMTVVPGVSNFFICMQYICILGIFLVHWLSFLSAYKHKRFMWSLLFSWRRLHPLPIDIWEMALFVLLKKSVGKYWITSTNGCLMNEVLRVLVWVHIINDRNFGRSFEETVVDTTSLEAMKLYLSMYLNLPIVFEASDDNSSTFKPNYG